MRVEHEIVVGRDPETVYAYLADASNLTEWQDGLEEVRGALAGPAAAGATWTEIRRAMGRRIEAVVEVVAAEPGRRFAVRSTAGPVSFQVDHALEEAPEGTRVSVVAEGEQSGVMKLASGLVGRQVREGFDRSFGRLKEILEVPQGNPGFPREPRP